MATRTVTDSSTSTWNFSVAGQAKVDVVAGQVFHYEQDTDPGAVGAGKWWVNTSNFTINRRNAINTAWDLYSGGGTAGGGGGAGDIVVASDGGFIQLSGETVVSP